MVFRKDHSCCVPFDDAPCCQHFFFCLKRLPPTILPVSSVPSFHFSDKLRHIITILAAQESPTDGRYPQPPSDPFRLPLHGSHDSHAPPAARNSILPVNSSKMQHCHGIIPAGYPHYDHAVLRDNLILFGKSLYFIQGSFPAFFFILIQFLPLFTAAIFYNTHRNQALSYHLLHDNHCI